MTSRTLLSSVALLCLFSLASCGYGSEAEHTNTVSAAPHGDVLSVDEVRIGYFANVTQATALVGLGEGYLARELGGTKIRTQVFNAGPSEIEALNAGSIDIGWIGPSPTVNGYTKSGGRNLRIVSGSASGGVSLVVNPRKIRTAGDIRGKSIATPQLGNTQDVALLNWLAGQDLKVDSKSGKGDVRVIRHDNKEIPSSFLQGSLDGAWVPEPTASQLVELGGKVLLQEQDLWKDNRFVVTHLIASQKFLSEHADVVEAVLRGSVKTNDWIQQNPASAKKAVNAQLKRITGKKLNAGVLDRAFANGEVLNDPLASTLRTETEHAVNAGVLQNPDLTGIYDLRLLNKVLTSLGRPTVHNAGLGLE